MQSTAELNAVLSEVSASLFAGADGFAGPALFPNFYTSKLTAQYYVMDESNFLGVPTEIQRAPGTPFSRSRTKVSGDAYKCRHYGHEEPVTDEDLSKYGKGRSALMAAARRVEHIIMANREIRSHALATSDKVPSATVALKWSDPASDPIGDAKAARTHIFTKCGLVPNVMAVPWSVYEALKEHPQIKALVRITSESSRWPQVLAALFDVDKFAVAKAAINGAPEGREWSAAEIWGSSVILARVDTNEDLRALSFGRTFIVADEKTPFGVESEVYRDDGRRANIVRSSQSTDEKLTGPLAGFHLKNTL